MHMQWYHAQQCSHCTIASSPLHGFLHCKAAAITHSSYPSQTEASAVSLFDLIKLGRLGACSEAVEIIGHTLVQ